MQIYPPEVQALFEQSIYGHVEGSTDWLEAFLSEPELDNLATRHIADDLDAEQEARVRAILASGTPR